MPRVTVTDRAYEMLLRYAQKELIRAELRERDRHWEVIISEELHVFLIGLRFENEPISQTLIRVLPMRTDGRR